jgi:hypothetical protein
MRTGLKLIFAVVVLTVFAVGQEPVPHAQKGSILDAVSLPGQMWSANGTPSPFEKNNVLSQTYFEQDATVFSTWNNSLSLTAYTSFSTTVDTNGYSWNNKVQPSSGIKLNKYFRSGIVSVATGYSYEDRFIQDKSSKAGARVDFVQYWFGWNPVSNPKSRLPGSSWGIVGHFSPMERGDLIEQAYLTQGVVARRFGHMALIPYSEITLGHDAHGVDWENKAIYGSGAKAAISSGEFYTDFGVGILHENRFKSGQSANGIKLFTDFCYAWSLFGRKGH